MDLTGDVVPPRSTLRNALLAALLPPPDAQAIDSFLLHADDAEALLAVGADRAALLLLGYDPGVPATASGRAPARDPQELAARLARVLAAQPLTPVYVAVVGGGADARAVVEAAARDAHELRTLGLYHLADDGKLERVAGRRLGELERAARAVPDARPLDAAQIAAALRATREGHLEEQRFAASVRGRFPLVSAAIAAICVVLFGLARLWQGRAPWGLVLFAMGSNLPEAVREGQLWRLLASAFLHGSSTHLLVNMMSLYFVGVFLEQVLGRHRYVLVYGLSALGGAIASALLNHGGPSVGASGAIWGLMTAGFGLALRPRGVLPALVAGRLRRGMVTPLVLNVAISFMPGIDKFAHFGGGAVGLALALSGVLGGRAKQGDAAAERLPTATWPVRLGAWAIALACLVSIGVALAWGRPWSLDQLHLAPEDLT